ncbi:MAG TPA: hypothetical protein VGO62_16085 [Myxococcota bacterium]|jgi:hypothetical protein
MKKVAFGVLAALSLAALLAGVTLTQTACPAGEGEGEGEGEGTT